MRRAIDVTEGIIPIGEFKTHASELIRQMHDTGRPIVITQRGRATAIMVSPEAFEESGYQEYARRRIKERIASAPTGAGRSGRQVRDAVKAALGRKRREG